MSVFFPLIEEPEWSGHLVCSVYKIRWVGNNLASTLVEAYLTLRGAEFTGHYEGR